MAAFEKFVGHFTSPTSADSSFGVTGVGFTPKLVIFFPTLRTTTGSDASSDVNFGMGAMTATDEWYVGSAAQDAAATMRINASKADDECIIVMSGASPGVIVEKANFVSMDSDGFTLNYTTASVTAYIVHYLALGGSHLKVDIGAISITTTAAPVTVESPSLGFIPVGYLLASDVRGNNTFSIKGSDASSGRFCIGGATAATEEFTISYFNERNVARSDTGRGQQSDRCIQMNDEGNSLDIEAEHSVLGSDTFTINVTNEVSTSTTAFGYIAFGGSIDCFMGNFTLNTSGATQAVTVETDFQPDAILFLGSDQTADGAVNDLVNSVGISDGTNDRGYLFGQDDNDANSEPTTNVSHTHCILSDWVVGTGAADDATINSLDTNGFTIGHNSNPGTAWRVGYFAIKDVPSPSLLDMPSRRRMRAHLAR